MLITAHQKSRGTKLTNLPAARLAAIAVNASTGLPFKLMSNELVLPRNHPLFDRCGCPRNLVSNLKKSLCGRLP